MIRTRSIHHPLQPLVLKLHVLSAPVLVFALGVVYTRHVVRQWRSGRSAGRSSGVGIVSTLLPMVLSGYLIQTVSAGELALPRRDAPRRREPRLPRRCSLATRSPRGGRRARSACYDAGSDELPADPVRLTWSPDLVSLVSGAGSARTGAALRAGLGWLLATNALALGIPWLLRGAVHALEAGTTGARLAAYAARDRRAGPRCRRSRGPSRAWRSSARRGTPPTTSARRSSRSSSTLDAPFYDTQRTGDIMSRGVNDLQLLQSFYGPGLMNALNTAIVYVGVLAVMLSLDAALTLVALALFPLLYFAVNRLSRRVYARSLAVQEQLAEISNRAQENISGIQQVKIYAQEEREIDGFAALCDDFRTKNLALARVRGLMVALIGVFSGLGTLLVLFVGGLHVIDGRITLGDFVAFNAYLAQLAWPTSLSDGSSTSSSAPRARCAARRRSSDAQPAIAPRSSPAFRVRTRTDRRRHRDPRPDLRLRRAAADGRRSPTSTVTIPKGSRVAIVGAVGSGKSTLAHLIARIYPAPAGTITIGGEDLSGVAVEQQDDESSSRTKKTIALAVVGRDEIVAVGGGRRQSGRYRRSRCRAAGSAPCRRARRRSPPTPQRRHGPRHRHSHSPPSEISTQPPGRQPRHRPDIAAASAETRSATQIVTSMPQPIGTSASRSRPNGIKRQATTPHGNVHIALSGTAIDIGERRIEHQVVKVIDRERLGADRRDERRDDDRAAIAQHLSRQASGRATRGRAARHRSRRPRSARRRRRTTSES